MMEVSILVIIESGYSNSREQLLILKINGNEDFRWFFVLTKIFHVLFFYLICV